MSARPIIACLGDSLTVGEHADGAPLHNHPWVAQLDALLFPRVGCGQFGLGGDTIPGMQTRFTADIKPAPFPFLNLWGGVNDLIADVSAATIWANMEALIDDAIASSMKVILTFTPGFGLYSGWSAPRQAQLDALRLLMFAKQGVTQVDLYQPFPVGLNDPANPTKFYPAFAYSDGLHINPTGQTYTAKLYQARLAPLLPGPPALELDFVGARGPGAMVVRTFPAVPLTQLYANIPPANSAGVLTSELVHDGVSFQPGYINVGSTRTAYSTGWEYYVVRDAGWPPGVTFSAFGP